MIRHNYPEVTMTGNHQVVWGSWGVMLRSQICGFPKSVTQPGAVRLSWCVTTAEMQKWAMSLVFSLHFCF